MAVEDGSSQPPWVRTFFGPTQGWRNVPESEIITGNNFAALDDTPDSYVGQAGKLVVVNLAETGVEYKAPPDHTFVGLDDTPNAYAGQAGKAVVVNPSATGLAFSTAVSGEDGIFNVRDFGAIGDGVVDDTAAIQAAVNASLWAGSDNSFHGKIFFPSGNYKTTAPIVVTTSGAGGQRSIIFEGCGSSSIVGGTFNDFIFKNTFTEPNPGINGFRDLAIFNGNKTLGSGCIEWPNVMTAFFEGLHLSGFCAIAMARAGGGSVFAPTIMNCHIVGDNIVHLADAVGIRLSSGGGGSIQDCIIRGYNHGIRGNGAFVSGIDFESNMMAIAAGVNADPNIHCNALGYELSPGSGIGGPFVIVACGFEANCVGVYQVGGRLAMTNCVIFGDAFCEALKALQGGIILTGNVVQGSPVITNILPNTNELQPGQFLKNIDENGTGYIVGTVNSVSQVTLQSNWNNGTQNGRALFGERLATHAYRARFDNNAVFIGCGFGGPYSTAVMHFENRSGAIFIASSAKAVGGAGVTWILQPGSENKYINNMTQFGDTPPPNASFVRDYNDLNFFNPTPYDTQEAYITDSTTSTFFAPVTVGGGSIHAKLRYDSSLPGWRVSG